MNTYTGIVFFKNNTVMVIEPGLMCGRRGYKIKQGKPAKNQLDLSRCPIGIRTRNYRAMT